MVVNVVKTDRTLLTYKSKPHVKVRFIVYLEITSFVKASISALRHGVEKKIVSFKPDSLLGSAHFLLRLQHYHRQASQILVHRILNDQ